MSLHDEGIERQAKSTYLDEVNRQIKQLEAENSYLSNVIKTKVINKRTGAVRTKTIYQVNEERQKACQQKYWIRGSRSNSISWEFHYVQNLPDGCLKNEQL